MKKYLLIITALIFYAVTIFAQQNGCTGTVCGTTSENGTVFLKAPPRAVFTSIIFASYGTPNGSCGNFSIGSCNASNSQSVVEAYVLNHNKASIPATNAVFGDPCVGTYKRLYIEAAWTSLPPCLFITTVTDINSSQAVVNWNAVPNASSYRVRAYPFGTKKYKYYGCETPIIDTFKKIVNLLPATQYKVEVMALFANDTDTSHWSAPYSFITEAYCNAPKNLTVSNIGNDSAQLNWLSPVTAVSHYELRIRKTGDTVWNVQSIRPIKISFVISDLSPNTSYQWQLRSVCVNISDRSLWAHGPDFTTGSSFASNTESSGALISGKFSASISPNPVRANVVTLHISNASANNYQLSITDMQGRVLINQNLLLNGSSNKTIDVSALSKGMYILKIINNKNKQQQIKFVKAN